jgi:hypothetical protein
VPYISALFITGLSLSAIANPSCDDGGIGGTGVTTESNSDDETIITSTQEGIGGTGIQTQYGIGGTGIVNMISGFDSVCLNSLEVHYWTTPTPADVFLLPRMQPEDVGKFLAIDF